MAVLPNTCHDDAWPALWALAGAEWTAREVRNWTETGRDISDCFDFNGGQNAIGIDFDPTCIGDAKTMAVSIDAGAYVEGKRLPVWKDSAPGKHKWSKHIQTFNPNDSPGGD